MTLTVASTPEAVLAALRALGVEPVRLENDSRRVRRGDVFVAYPGEFSDGRSFIAQAIAAGAAAVLWEARDFDWPGPAGTPNVGVHGIRAVAGELAGALAGHPSRDLWMVGVTGTNGKTTCTQWIASALTALGRRTAVIGTLGSGFPGELSSFGNTTPDAIALHSMLRKFSDLGARATAMEVSSHGLVQERVAGAHFDIALFTNLTRDHLDYHGDMASYGEAKARLFSWPGLRCAVINVDDAFGRALVGRITGSGTHVITYGLGGGAVSGHRLNLTRFGLELEIRTPWGDGRLASPLMGAYNASNLLGVLGVLLASDVPLASALTALGELAPVAGRMQTVGGGDKPLAVIDYAHTPDALEQALRALRAHVGAGRLICVFGCGGDRDAGKRPMMGEIAARFADQVIVTSDNPRGEDPAAIIAAIVAGAGKSVDAIVDRRQAISAAIDAADIGDVVLIAGKGHEDYQEVGRQRFPFSDAHAARACLDGWQSRAFARSAS